jgi:sporulation protein YlmC with PRC-barrel domain
MIENDTIINADIKSNAAIELGKLADATIDIKTGNYTLQLTDKNKFIKMNITSTANTVTVPTDASVTFPAGAQIHIIQYGSGKTQVVGASGAVILYATPGAYLRAQYSSATLLKCAAANTWMLMGDLSAS